MLSHTVRYGMYASPIFPIGVDPIQKGLGVQTGSHKSCLARKKIAKKKKAKKKICQEYPFP